VSAAVKIKSLEFRKEREATWRELDELIARGLKNLDGSELTRLPILYRSALSSLAVARSFSLDASLVTYLEALSARAHLVVYASKQPLFEALWRFFSSSFPRAVRAAARPILLSGFVMLLGTVTSAVMVARDSERFYTFVAPEYAQGRGPDTPTEELRKQLYDGADSSIEQLSAFGTFLFTHNARIGMLCFAVGFLLGIPTLYLLFYNGLLLGAFAGLYQDRGLGLDLWGWLLPHGVPELLAVVLCGGAGLMLARALVFPEQETRLASLARAGRQAAVIVMGAVMLFLVAGLFEGLFRQLVTSLPVRLAVATLNFSLVALYFGVAGRKDPA
jgi:uncharacterized membrane protein SpoIIM required for sporulation